MIHTNKIELYEKIDVYLYGDIDGRNDEVLSAAHAVWDRMSNLENEFYFDGEIDKVLNNFNAPGIDDVSDPAELTKKTSPLDKVKKVDAVYIAMHFGFLYGLIYAENARLHFE